MNLVPQSSTGHRTFLSGLDPVELFELLETHHDEPGDATAVEPGYRDLYQRVRTAYLERTIEARPFAALLDEVDAYTGVETATRAAGFVLGFEPCRQLLLGELDLEALHPPDDDAPENEGGIA